MYCPNCGKVILDDETVCSSCGDNLDIDALPVHTSPQGAAPLNTTSQGTTPLDTSPATPLDTSPQGATIVYLAPQKSVGVGVVLSFLLAGLGHLYAEQIGKGLCLAIAYIALLTFTQILTLTELLTLEPLEFTVFLLFTIIVAFALWLWALFDTREIINRYNRYTRRTGNPPW